MKLFLFGWAETWEAAHELKMIESVIHSLQPEQLLHVPFARVKESSEPEWQGDRFHTHISLLGIEYLNASNPDDMARVDNPVVLIMGGSEHKNLIVSIHNTPWLLDIIKNADYVIGESAGSKVLSSYYISRDSDWNPMLLDWLNIVPNCVIEGHYTQRNKQHNLAWGMEHWRVSHGIGIDSCTAMVLDLDKNDYLSDYEKIGERDIVVIG